MRLAIRTTIHETTRDNQIPCWGYKFLHLLNAGCIKSARLASQNYVRVRQFIVIVANTAHPGVHCVKCLRWFTAGLNKMRTQTKILAAFLHLNIFSVLQFNRRNIMGLRNTIMVTLMNSRSQWPRGLRQCFSTAGPRPGTGSWHQLYRTARSSPGICHFSFLSIFH